jgi:hypothetical protein
LKKVSVTYKAPPGDSKVTEVFGYTFFDGRAESLIVTDQVLAKLKGNQHFDVGEPIDLMPEGDEPTGGKGKKEK